MSFFSKIEAAPEDPIFGLQILFQNDPRLKKVNLGVGAYKNDLGQPEVLHCVRKAEELLLKQQLNKEYLPISGHAGYIDEALKLIYGFDSESLRPKVDIPKR